MKCPKCKCPEGCGGDLQLITENGVRYAKCDKCHRLFSRDDLQDHMLKNLWAMDGYGMPYSIHIFNNENIKNNSKDIHTWIPGFRTGTPWKCIIASLGYCFMTLYSIWSILEYFLIWDLLIQETIAIFLYIWLAPFIAADIGYFDKKISFLKDLPAPARLIIRIFLCILIFCIGALVEV